MTLSFYQHSKSQISTASVGAQAHRLTQLLDAGFPVPRGFIAAAETCRTFFSHGNLEGKIRALLSRCNFHDPADLSRVSKNIRKLILTAEIPTDAAQSLLEAAMKLGGERVMLTASPVTHHDGVHNRAHERRFGIEGEANILLGIRELWAAQFSPDELYYIYTAQEHDFPCMAVCVQEQPRAVATGILYTTDPSDKRACVLHVVWGEGAYHRKLMGADSYWIEKDSGTQKDIERNLQPREHIWIHGELEELVVPQSRQKKQKLSPIFYKKIATLARDVQQKLFFPQEVTFLFDGKSFYIISSEPMVDATRITEHTPSPQTKHLLLKGIGVTPGIVTGIVRVVRGTHETDVKPSEIVVAKSLAHIAEEVLRTAKGIIVEEEPPNQACMSIANKGIAFLMSAMGATDLLEPGSFVTLHTPRGEVSKGAYTSPVSEAAQREHILRSATRVGTVKQLGSPIFPKEIRGHIVISPTSIIKEIGVHPMKLAREHKTKVLTEKIARALSQACELTKETPLLFDISHLTTAEYRELSGGLLFETLTEANPLLGYWGAARIIQNPELIEAELLAISTVRKDTYGKEISLLIPPTRSSYEVFALQKVFGNHQLSRTASCRHYLSLSIPSLVWQIETLAQTIDGVVLDLDAVASHLLAVDPHSDVFHFAPSDIEPSLFAILEEVYTRTVNQGLSLIVRGRLAAHDAFLSFVVKKGIHEVIVPSGSVETTTIRLVALEQELISNV